MNTYYKLMPNVFLAKCTEEHIRGEIIEIETKYGKVNEHEVHKLYGTKDGYYYYSITRADGFNCQERAKAKAEQRKEWADSAKKQSHEAWEASHEGAEFLALGEPIKVGHHSEKRHRALLERNDNRMRKSVELAEKADAHLSKVEYWEGRAEEINLSMPESLEYFADKLEKAQTYHALLKSGEIPREHAYSLTYAKKEVNELEKKFSIARRLWGITNNKTIDN